MKNLPLIVFVAAIASLVILAIVSTAGVPFEFMLVASYVVGAFAAIGVVATFVLDYGPRTSNSAKRSPVTDASASVAAAAGSRNIAARRPAKATGSPALEGAMATLGLHRNPATLMPL